MHMRDCSILIRREHFDETLESIQSLKGQETIKDSSGYHFSWVDTHEFMRAGDLGKALEAWRWEPTYDIDGNIDNIDFVGEKWGDDFLMFTALAPYVEDGSYIEMGGEDDAIWRWKFKDGMVKEQYAEIVWDDK